MHRLLSHQLHLKSLVTLAVMIGVPTAVGAQDLVSSVTAIDVQATQVTYNLQVCNQGLLKASSWLGLYYHLSAPPDCGTSPSHSWNVTNLNPGECRQFTQTQSNSVLGNFTAWSRADYNCQVTEENENNNNGSKTYSVLAELQLTTVTASVSDTTVTYTITVRNSGAAQATPFTLGLYYDLLSAPSCSTTPSQTWTIDSLSSNTTVTRQHVRANVAAGTYQVWAMVDSGCAVEELNETNNTASRSYAVGPDINLSNPAVSVSGSSVTYSVYVCNLGTTSTGAFEVKFWYHALSAPGCSTTGADKTWTVSNLSSWAGDPTVSCTTLTYVRNNTLPGSYTAWFFGDSSCSIA
ncbi:MAG: CARDB domain-containing protein, partial [Chloroflexota bacterium]